MNDNQREYNEFPKQFWIPPVASSVPLPVLPVPDPPLQKLYWDIDYIMNLIVNFDDFHPLSQERNCLILHKYLTSEGFMLQGGCIICGFAKLEYTINNYKIKQNIKLRMEYFLKRPGEKLCYEHNKILQKIRAPFGNKIADNSKRSPWPQEIVDTIQLLTFTKPIPPPPGFSPLPQYQGGIIMNNLSSHTSDVTLTEMFRINLPKSLTNSEETYSRMPYTRSFPLQSVEHKTGLYEIANLNETTGLNGTSGLNGTTGLNATSGLNEASGLNQSAAFNETAAFNESAALNESTTSYPTANETSSFENSAIFNQNLLSRSLRTSTPIRSISEAGSPPPGYTQNYLFQQLPNAVPYREISPVSSSIELRRGKKILGQGLYNTNNH